MASESCPLLLSLCSGLHQFPAHWESPSLCSASISPHSSGPPTTKPMTLLRGSPAGLGRLHAALPASWNPETHLSHCPEFAGLGPSISVWCQNPVSHHGHLLQTIDSQRLGYWIWTFRLLVNAICFLPQGNQSIPESELAPFGSYLFKGSRLPDTKGRAYVTYFV